MKQTPPISSVVRAAPTSLFYGGHWHDPRAKEYFETSSPADGSVLGRVAVAGRDDIDLAVHAAQAAHRAWRDVPPLERARIMRQAADLFREHARELAFIDAIDGGNPIAEMESDVLAAATAWDYFAGLVTEIKGSSVPMGPHSVNFSVREPRGVVLRIAPFNHPFMFSAGRLAAPLAVGNACIVKPPEQAPLSAIRMAELLAPLMPPGVVSVLTGDRSTGAMLVEHPGIAMVALTGSVPTGRAVMRSAADRLKPLVLELGGKNALVAYGDADPDEVAAAAVRGMNFTWAGQSCGSTSRAFIHEDIYDRVIARIPHHLARYVPGLPGDPATTMGAIINKAQYDKVLDYIRVAHAEGARLLVGGKTPAAPELSRGFFIEPTVFVDVAQHMRIAQEEIFGPILSVLPWKDEERMLGEVNAVDYGLTCSIWTSRIDRAHRLAQRVEVGFVWINEVGKHFLGAPYGGYKQSGLGREECFEEALQYTQEKHIHVNLASPAA